jgi:hypothetical protein
MQRARGVVLGGIAMLALVALGITGAGCMDFGGESADDPTPTQTPASEPTPTETAENGQSSDVASFSVSVADTPSTAVVGETATVEVAVENVGNASGTQALTLENDTALLGLDAGASETVVLNWTAVEPGTHELSVESANDTATATVEVLEATPEFGVEIAGTSAPVTDRDRLNVTVEVTNAGTVGSTQTVNLTAAGTVVDSAAVPLDSGASATTTLTWDLATPHGEYDLQVTSANDTATTTAVVKAIEEPAVAGRVSVMTADVPAEDGVIHLRDAGSDERLATADLAPDGTFRFTDLEPGTEYRLAVSGAVATHPEANVEIGGSSSFPTTEYTFTARSVQRSADLVYGYEIRGADTYRWEFYKDQPVSNRLEGYGRYNQSEAYVRSRQTADIGDPTIRQLVYLENKTFLNDSSRPAPVWYENPQKNFHPPTTKPHRIVQNPIQEFIQLNRRFEGQTTINETTVHEYSISQLTDYPEATVFINPDTGYIIKWEAKHFHWLGPDGKLYSFPAEIWFTNHNTGSISIESPR